jgi:transposase-like protein
MFTRTSRRWSWTGDQKARIVTENYAGGDTVCGVARRHDLTRQRLFTWAPVGAWRSLDGEDSLRFALAIVEAEFRSINSFFATGAKNCFLAHRHRE